MNLCVGGGARVTFFSFTRNPNLKLIKTKKNFGGVGGGIDVFIFPV